MIHGLSLWAVRREGLLEAVVSTMAARRTRTLPAGAERLAGSGGSSGAYRLAGVAVVPVVGPIGSRRTFEATSYEEIMDDLDAAMADPAVRSIVLEVDSPGGAVAGIDDAVAMIGAAAAEKPMAAHVHGMGASAAYWLAAATGRIVAQPTSVVGSIGAIISYLDVQPILQGWGARLVQVVAEDSPNKRLDPDSPEGRAELQALVDHAGAMFVADVARLRNVSANTVRERYGAGLVFSAPEALARGMVDEVRGFFDTLRAAAAQAEESGMLRMFGKAAAPAAIEDVPPAAADETDAPVAPIGEVTCAAPDADEAIVVAEAAPEDAAPAAPDEIAAAVAAALVAERARVAGIFELAAGGHPEIVAALIADGASVDGAARRLLAAERAARNDRLAVIRSVEQDAAGLSEAPNLGIAASAPVPAAGTDAEREAQARREWANSAAAREEFPSEAAFVAWRKRNAGVPLARRFPAE